MIKIRQNIWKNDEYSYEAAYGFVPNIRTYIHEGDQIRSAMLVVPGGGYCMVVPSEAEIVAKEFYERGMNAFVLTYTTDITMSIPLKNQPLKDISRAIRLIRSKSEEYKINPDKLVICGFSAGGHLCGTMCTHFDEIKDTDEVLKDISDRPDAAILSYPVITTGKYTHEASVESLLGKNPSKSELEYYSVEKNVKNNTPPCFLWQTLEDGLVPVENTYVLADALREKNIAHAHYIFPNGGHGLSVATRDFFEGKHGEEFTFEQLGYALENVRNNTAINVTDHRRKELIEQFDNSTINEENANDIEEQLELYKDVRMWPDLAYMWINKLI